MRAHPIRSTGVVPYRSSTDVEVGTTTMRLGVTRHGPRAPETSQLGKYDALTNTGEPGRSTRNAMRSSPTRTDETRAGSTGVTGGSAGAPRTRRHSSGPSAASGTFQREGSWNHAVETSSHAFSPLPTPVITTGSAVSGATRPEPATS